MNIFKVVQKLSSFLLESHIFLELCPPFEMIPSLTAHQVCSIGHSPFTRYHRRSQPGSSRSSRKPRNCNCQSSFLLPIFHTALSEQLTHLLAHLFCTFKGAVKGAVRPRAAVLHRFASFVQFLLLRREAEVHGNILFLLL